MYENYDAIGPPEKKFVPGPANSLGEPVNKYVTTQIKRKLTNNSDIINYSS